ncbi:hypothetical protein VitviT2T_004288 [Vitis vinifera]|uniref:tRNA synthetases class I catalytic domain-containing protein n=1 Tax=Vitis vinifera TaxID=29760 RepID=A0ABY9BR03_VITVI|nr:hypothetical protein VitviT2T_004288 [Vitis vinifera]
MKMKSIPEGFPFDSAIEENSQPMEADKEFHVIFWNYFIIGLDIEDLSQKKDGCCGSCSLTSWPRNIVLPIGIKTKDEQGEWKEISIPHTTRSIICVNLPCFPDRPNVKKKYRNFKDPFVDDGLLEVICFKDAWHGNDFLPSKDRGECLVQVETIRFELYNSAVNNIHMSIDGNRWKHPLPIEDDNKPLRDSLAVSSMAETTELRVYNTMTQQKEIFKPVVDGKVSMYACGVTAYDLSHLGHARAAVCFDVLYRLVMIATWSCGHTPTQEQVVPRSILMAGSPPFPSFNVEPPSVEDAEMDLELPWDPLGSKALTDPGRSNVLLPADDAAAPTCSKNRTCTTTRKSSSFCTACMQVSVDSLLQSISRRILFLSLMLIPGCSFIYMSMAWRHESKDQSPLRPEVIQRSDNGPEASQLTASEQIASEAPNTAIDPHKAEHAASTNSSTQTVQAILSVFLVQISPRDSDAELLQNHPNQIFSGSALLFQVEMGNLILTMAEHQEQGKTANIAQIMGTK